MRKRRVRKPRKDREGPPPSDGREDLWKDGFWDEVAPEGAGNPRRGLADIEAAALARLRERRPKPRWPPARPQAEDLLWVASLLFLGANLLLILAVFANVIGGLGALTPRNALFAAFALDLPAAVLLAWIVWTAAMQTTGRPHWFRRIAALLLLLWAGLSAVWRFVLPAVLGTNVQDLFTSFLNASGGLPADIRGNVPALYNLFGVWIAAAAAFVGANVLLGLARRAAPEDDWVHGLPSDTWIAGSAISLVATVFIILSLLDILAGREPAENFYAWLVAKTVVAPNVLLSGYASSLDLGWKLRADRAAGLPPWERRH